MFTLQEISIFSSYSNVYLLCSPYTGTSPETFSAALLVVWCVVVVMAVVVPVLLGLVCIRRKWSVNTMNLSHFWWFLAYMERSLALVDLCTQIIEWETLSALYFQHFILHNVEMYFGALHNHCADVMRSDTPSGIKPLHLQVGAFKLLQIRCICRRVLVIEFVLFVNLSIAEIQLCKFRAHFLLESCHYCM